MIGLRVRIDKKPVHQQYHRLASVTPAIASYFESRGFSCYTSGVEPPIKRKDVVVHAISVYENSERRIGIILNHGRTDTEAVHEWDFSGIGDSEAETHVDELSKIYRENGFLE